MEIHEEEKRIAAEKEQTRLRLEKEKAEAERKRKEEEERIKEEKKEAERVKALKEAAKSAQNVNRYLFHCHLSQSFRSGSYFFEVQFIYFYLSHFIQVSSVTNGNSPSKTTSQSTISPQKFEGSLSRKQEQVDGKKSSNR